MDAQAVFEISEAMERQLCLTDRTWWREVIDPLQDEMSAAEQFAGQRRCPLCGSESSCE
jgi:hypothetical protein